MKTIQRWHDKICEDFINGKMDLEVFLELDRICDQLKHHPIYQFNNN